tara:strand:+ start:397 stop:1698 length:1302 start_codon:yes stop_codon:yes gene_type:complete
MGGRDTSWVHNTQNQQGLDAFPVDSLSSIQSAKCEYVIVNREDDLKTVEAKAEIIRNLGIGDINSIYVTTAIETTKTRHSGLGVLWLGPVKPLFRGYHDVPTAGDDVAIIWVEEEPYYLCVLNSKNSVQCNWNAIVEQKNILKYATTRGKESGTGTIDGKELKGIPDNVHYTGLGRLEKPYSDILDHPPGGYTSPSDTLNAEEYLRTKGSVGDMYLEGKFGNAIRFGSRNNYPHLTISNLRQKADSKEDNADDVLETPEDGGLISILSNHTIQDNFLYPEPWLPSCNTDKNKNPIVFEPALGKETPANQMLLTSDRITLNSRQDGLVFSSFDDIEMGSANNINIRANEALIDSTAVFIGKEGKTGESMVLGDSLVDILREILEAIAKLNVSGVIAGFSGPIGSSPTYSANIAPIISKLENIKSKIHKIESNKK